MLLHLWRIIFNRVCELHYLKFKIFYCLLKCLVFILQYFIFILTVRKILTKFLVIKLQFLVLLLLVISLHSTLDTIILYGKGFLGFNFWKKLCFVSLDFIFNFKAQKSLTVNDLFIFDIVIPGTHRPLYFVLNFVYESLSFFLKKRFGSFFH